MKTIIILLLCLCYYPLHDVCAIDPWDIQSEKPECKCNGPGSSTPKLKCETETINNILYKKIIQIIVENGELQVNNNEYDLSIAFHFSKNDFDKLQEYIRLDKLTDFQMRKIDGIFTENIHKKSLLKKTAESFVQHVSFFIKTHYVQLLFAATFLITCYAIIKSDWSKIPVKWLFISVICLVIYIWEVRNVIEEAQEEESARYLRECTFDFIFYQYVKPDCFTVKTVSYFFKYGNPIQIFPNILSKLVFKNVSFFLSTVDECILKICGNVNSFMYTPVYITLNIVFFGIVIFFIIGIIANYFFNQSFSMNLLFFNFNIREKIHNLRPDHPQQATERLTIQSPTGHNVLTGETVTHLITVVKELAQNRHTDSCIAHIPQSENISRTKIEFRKPCKPLKQSINLKSNEQECTIRFKQKRVSSVPDNLWKLGGGDSIT